MAKKKPKGYSIYYSTERGCYVGQTKGLVYGEVKRRSFYGATEKEVLRKIKNFKSQEMAGEFIEANFITLNELAERILEDQHDLNEITESTYTRKRETLKKLAPIGDRRIQDITEDMIKRFLVQHIHYSQSIINKIYQMLKATFDEAVRRKIITDSPMLCIKKPKTNSENTVTTQKVHKPKSSVLFCNKLKQYATAFRQKTPRLTICLAANAPATSKKQCYYLTTRLRPKTAVTLLKKRGTRSYRKAGKTKTSAPAILRKSAASPVKAQRKNKNRPAGRFL